MLLSTVWPLSITRSATPWMSLLNAAAWTPVRTVAARACDHDREALHFGTYRSELRQEDGRVAQALGQMDRGCRVRSHPRHFRDSFWVTNSSARARSGRGRVARGAMSQIYQNLPPTNGKVEAVRRLRAPPSPASGARANPQIARVY
jgi:hypothetical protein